MRKSNIELLRIISMLMIISSHFVIHGSIIMTNNVFIKTLANMFELGNLGVLLFILITGYFYENNEKKPFSKII